MSVWLCMPSKRPADHVIILMRRWVDRGYGVCLQRDPGEEDNICAATGGLRCVTVERPYSGYPEAVNHLIKQVAEYDQRAEWFVCAGDDTLPDPHKDAETIARECCEHFGSVSATSINGEFLGYRSSFKTFGVMQPTGDDWSDKQGRIIERVAGSPWIGREFARRINGGRGPLWPEYFHCGADEELQNVAIKYNVFWQRPDITHLHNNWGRPKPGKKHGYAHDMPAFLKRANSEEEWANFKRVFPARKSSGFPGSEPIA